MSLPYRSFTREVSYQCPLFEAALLVRTSQRYVGLSRAALARGQAVVVAMYGLPRTPFTDSVLTSIAWYPAEGEWSGNWLAFGG